MSLIVYQIQEDADFDHAFRIRQQVFVEEQQVPEEEEWDEFEHLSKHYLAVLDGRAVGTARWRRTLTGDIKLERFAVLADCRGLGVGKAILLKMLSDVPHSPDHSVYLHAQLSAKGFYARYGFVEQGDIFDEAGILHVKMKFVGLVG